MRIPKWRFGRDVKLNIALTPCTFASAVSRGSCRSAGKTAQTDALLMAPLVVHGINCSFWFIAVNDTMPFRVVCAGIL